ncbi:hypothetical protein FB451DRAFT_1519350 [Mycena latifolia]|nr:hypothetical protein FB451DRAFT_1519350 [Mycena latifolia]
MYQFAILFNPSARVYNLRLLLLANIATGLCVGLSGGYSLTICSILICIHHVLGLFRWTMRGLAAIDLALVVLEMDGAAYVQYQVSLWSLASLSVLLFIALASVVVAAVFRTATIVKSKGRIWGQRFDFLGCCRHVHPRYTPLTILLNRSLARPLVRGESRPIIFARAVIISGIVLGAPAFGVYTIFIMPLNAQFYTRASVPSASDVTFDASYPSGNVTVVLVCPCSWEEVANISISIPAEVGGVYVWPVQGDLSDDVLFWSLSTAEPGPTPLLPGSHLFGLMFWTRREHATGPVWGISTPSVTMFIAEVAGLQPYPPSDAFEANSTTLTLVPAFGYATEFVQETVDATALSGVATFGGFWTFLNGAFALLFGANVIYFAFGEWKRSLFEAVLTPATGRRPLSALGVVHVFQRRALVRRWHDDFPAIYREGGAPGSESAGIVAFIRERLVDLGADPRASLDLPDNTNGQTRREASHHPELGACAHPQVTGSTDEKGSPRRAWKGALPETDAELKPGYRLDEIPLLDMDLGLGEGFKV